MHKEIPNHDKTRVECVQVTYSVTFFMEWKLGNKNLTHHRNITFACIQCSNSFWISVKKTRNGIKNL